MKLLLTLALCFGFISLQSYAQSISSINISVGRGQVSLDIDPPADLKNLISEGIVNPETNEINWDKVSGRKDIKMSGASNIDYSHKKVASFFSNDEFHDPKDLYSKLQSSSATSSKACSASIDISSDGNFSISSSDFPNPHSKVSGNDDDGFIALTSLNAQISSSKQPYVMTNVDKKLVKDAFNRAKAYWNTASGIQTTGDFSQIAAGIKREDIQKHSDNNSLDYDESTLDSLYSESVQYFNGLAEIEKVLSKDKLTKEDTQKLKDVLSKDFEKHFYELKPNNKSQELCGAPKARCCTFERENVLSQSLCSQLNPPSSKADTIAPSLSCSVSINGSTSGQNTNDSKGSSRQ